MKATVIVGLLVMAFVAAQEYRISQAKHDLQNAERNNQNLSDQLSDLLSDNASIYNALMQSRAQADALSKAHMLARQNLQRAERNHARALQQLAEYRSNPAYADWADTAVPDTAELWLRQLSGNSHQTSGTAAEPGAADRADNSAAGTGNTARATQ